MKNENEAQLFEEGSAAAETGVQVSSRDAGPAAESSETRPGNTNTGAATAAAPDSPSGARPAATRQQISRFCSAVRVGTPLACGPQEAMHSARACIRANESIQKKTRLDV